MPWMKVGDDAATFPALMSVMGQEGADDRILNEVAGFLFRIATLSGAHLTDYVVDVGTCFMIGGARTQELIRFCVNAGLLEKAEAYGGQAVRIVENEDFINLKLKKEVEWGRQRLRDTRDPRLIVPVRKRDGDQCRYCGVVVQWRGRSTNRTGTYDHIHQGQAATADTLVVACLRCNSSRQDNPQWDDDNPLQPPPAEPVYSEWSVKFLRDNGVHVVQNLKVDPGKAKSSASEGPSTADPAPSGASVDPATAVDPGIHGAVDRLPSPVDPGVQGGGASVDPATAVDPGAPVVAAPEEPGAGSRKVPQKVPEKSDPCPIKNSFAGSGRERTGQVGKGREGPAAAPSGPSRRRRRRKR